MTSNDAHPWTTASTSTHTHLTMNTSAHPWITMSTGTHPYPIMPKGAHPLMTESTCSYKQSMISTNDFPQKAAPPTRCHYTLAPPSTEVTQKPISGGSQAKQVHLGQSFPS